MPPWWLNKEVVQYPKPQNPKAPKPQKPKQRLHQCLSPGSMCSGSSVWQGFWLLTSGEWRSSIDASFGDPLLLCMKCRVFRNFSKLGKKPKNPVSQKAKAPKANERPSTKRHQMNRRRRRRTRRAGVVEPGTAGVDRVRGGCGGCGATAKMSSLLMFQCSCQCARQVFSFGSSCLVSVFIFILFCILYFFSVWLTQSVSVGFQVAFNTKLSAIFVALTIPRLPRELYKV